MTNAQRVVLEGRVLVIADPAMSRLWSLVQRLAASELPVLICGETGAGKEHFAYALHHGSQRRGGAFVTVNCAALPDTLVESELFGFEKGAFSGAVCAKPGRFEAAQGGTLFLDEIGELPLPSQGKLLRALETRKLTRLGDVKERPIDIRVVAATNRDLEAEVKAGRFRADLYFRLSAATVTVPPLRERPVETPVLAEAFIAEACERAGRAPMVLTQGAAQRLAAWHWPGNVRELKNLMEYVVATSVDGPIEAWHFGERLKSAPKLLAPRATPPVAPVQPLRTTFRPIAEELRELEQRRMEEALAATGGVQKRAAELIGMPLRTFVFKLRQYDIGARRRIA